MPRRRRHRANWPYRFTWLAILSAVAMAVIVGTLCNAPAVGHLGHDTDWWIAFVASCLNATVAVMFIAVGASLGSFLNVVAYRLPLGRTVGGHSGCPYCCTPIRGDDNVPVLAWIKLRGRCRRCHLPISPQYPLVEFSVAMIFLSVFVTEFARGGANLPSMRSAGGWGLYYVNVSDVLIFRLVSYAFVMCGIVATALIVLKQRRVPLQLFVWLLLAVVACVLIQPHAVIESWRNAAVTVPHAASSLSSLDLRFDALLTVACGMAAGVVLARMLATVLYSGFDRTLIASDAATSYAQAWIGVLAVCGALLGWQAVVPLGWSILICTLTVAPIARICFERQDLRIVEPVVWSWLGLLVFRAGWSWFTYAWWEIAKLSPLAIPVAVQHIAGALLLFPLCWWLARSAAEGEALEAVPVEEEHIGDEGVDEM